MDSKQTSSGVANERGRDALRPTEIPLKGWKDILLRVKEQLERDHVSIIAAGVAFYAFLAVFPAIAAIVSIYGLLTDPGTVQQHLAELTSVLPKDAHDLLAEQLSGLTKRSDSTLSLGAFIAIVAAIWSAKKGANALIEGMNIAYHEVDDRGFFKKTLVTLAFTSGAVVMAIVSGVLVVGLPAALGNLGLPDFLAVLLSVARWLILSVILLCALAVIYRYAPHRSRPRWRWVTWGSVVAVTLWLVASWGFSYYVSNFDSYNKTYGSLAAVVILLMWTFISSYIVLLGAEINAEMEHQTERDSTCGEEQPMGNRGAYHADTLGKSSSAS